MKADYIKISHTISNDMNLEGWFLNIINEIINAQKLEAKELNIILNDYDIDRIVEEYDTTKWIEIY